MDREELAVKIHKALGHPIRYKIIRFLADGPRCVCELNADVEFSQSNLSQHLRVLKDAGLLRSEKVGLKMMYELGDPAGLRQLLRATDTYVEDYVRTLQEKLEMR